MSWSAPPTFAVGETLTAGTMNAGLRDNLAALNQVGKIEYYICAATAVETVINGRCLELNGVAVSRTTYATLFGYLNGLTPALPFGSGDGSTTFNLPDSRGRMLVQLASGGHTDVATLGNSDGVALANRRPKHRHTPHTHTSTVDGGTGGAVTGVWGSNANKAAYTGASTGSTDGGSGNSSDPLDASAYLVAGVWAVVF